MTNKKYVQMCKTVLNWRYIMLPKYNYYVHCVLTPVIDKN